MRALASIVIILGFCGVATAVESVQSKEHTFRVRYKDGTLEQYKVRWVASRDLQWREDGHPAEPLKGWFTDTRQCHWTAAGAVERRVYLVNKNGKEFEDGNRYQVFRSSTANKGSDFVLTNLRSENCGDAAARRDSDYNNVRTVLLNSFEGIVTTDFERVTADFRKDGEVTIGN